MKATSNYYPIWKKKKSHSAVIRAAVKGGKYVLYKQHLWEFAWLCVCICMCNIWWKMLFLLEWILFMNMVPVKLIAFDFKKRREISSKLEYLT